MERVRELFEYHPETGLFVRRIKVNTRNGAVGAVAGWPGVEGRTILGVDGKRYYANRLAWLYMTGGWPIGMVDHIDLDTSNNTWSNLRDCGNGQNKMNSAAQANNKLGVKNVHRIRNGSYKASVGKDKRYHQKIFKTVEDAAAWAEAKRKELHGEFARGTK